MTTVIFKYLKREEVETYYRSALRQVAVRLLESRINQIIRGEDSVETEGESEKILQRLEADYKLAVEQFDTIEKEQVQTA